MHLASLRVWFLGMLLAYGMLVHASNDTLTVRQVYNFSVGDTFDYRIDDSNADSYYSNSSYYRKVLMQKTFSSNLDSVFLVYSLSTGGFEYDTVFHLDSIPVFHDTALFTQCSLQFTFDDTTTYPSHITNSIRVSCFESGCTYSYSQGLGRTLYSTGEIAVNSNGCICHSEELIYYSNSATSIGTPYYVANGSTRIKYIPLPEECAIWTQSIYSSANGLPPWQLITEQLKTGNKIYRYGVNFIELICSIENGVTNHFTHDSLLGYFYNDTTARLAFFTQSIDSPIQSTVICNFNLLAGSSCGYMGEIEIDSIFIGGSYRTVWRCTGGTQGNGICSPDIIAGIGSIGELLPLNSFAAYCPDLTCFSICGQTLYPNSTTASCPLLTGLYEIEAFSGIRLLPNPAHNDCNLTITNVAESLSASVFDVTGREVLPLFSNQKTTAFNFSTAGLSAGVYLVRVTDANGKRDVVKLVKE